MTLQHLAVLTGCHHPPSVASGVRVGVRFSLDREIERDLEANPQEPAWLGRRSQHWRKR